jgi:hypothetical protein
MKCGILVPRHDYKVTILQEFNSLKSIGQLSLALDTRLRRLFPLRDTLTRYREFANVSYRLRWGCMRASEHHFILRR